MYNLIVVGTLTVIFSDYKAVCDVDPSDTASILLEQLKVQNKQLDLDSLIIKQQQEQLSVQNEQLLLIKNLVSRPTQQPAYVTVIISVACTTIGYIMLILTKRLVKYVLQRYNISPEMPQTPPSGLIDFAHDQYQMAEIEHMRSVHMKSPTVYFSSESGDEE